MHVSTGWFSLGLFSPKADTEGQTPKADEDAEEREIRVTVFPTGGGRPYICDVTVDDQGLFELEPDSGKEYKIARGSVWQEGSTERAIVHEDHEQTIGPHAIVDEQAAGISPHDLHGVARNNLWVQFDEVSRRKSAWQQTSTWAYLGLAVLVLVAIIWQVKTIGDGFDQLADALRNAEFVARSTGHQDISPKG